MVVGMPLFGAVLEEQKEESEASSPAPLTVFATDEDRTVFPVISEESLTFLECL